MGMLFVDVLIGQGACRMSVSYKKLWIRIIEQDMTNAMLREKVKVSGSTFSKLKHNQYVSLEILERDRKSVV